MKVYEMLVLAMHGDYSYLKKMLAMDTLFIQYFQLHNGFVVSMLFIESQAVTSVWASLPQVTNAVGLFQYDPGC